MKTAISLPDQLFDEAEDLAAELEISRSELYQRALKEYLERHSDERQRFIEQVNEVCERVDMSPEAALYARQFDFIPGDDEW